MKNVKLANGIEMPILGFGVFQIPEEKDCIQAVTDALDVGYRHIDTAASYMNERAVGQALHDSGIAREELFITTKLWVQDASESQALKAFDRSMDKLGLNYLDLYLIHQPYGDVYGAWRAMEKLYKEGRIKAIGVSNFYPDRLADFIVHNEIAPMVNQIETHPFFQRADYQAQMSERGVQIESWAPFAEGRNDLFSNPELAKIAATHGKSIAQVVLRWLIQRDVVVIPKSVRKERMAENFDVFNFDLSPEDLETIAKLDGGISLFFDHRTLESAEWLGTRTLDL
ncbi:MAG: promiscuous glyoxal/methylglyoxal reductase [Actinomycetota bacterium]|jgi:diketogulonate reductase-like aldo/keto reductase